jgi:hypothetical protein
MIVGLDSVKGSIAQRAEIFALDPFTLPRPYISRDYVAVVSC